MHKLVLDGISYNVASLVQLVKYGAINAVDPTTMGYYVIKFLSMQVSNSVELVVKA